MVFIYTYKTSDGVRHQAEMSAPSREEVFATLRREGIRPIKVWDRDPPKPKSGSPLGRLALIAWGVSILGVGIWWGTRTILERQRQRGRYQDDSREAFQKLIERADALQQRHDAEMKLLRLDLAQDMSYLAKTNGWRLLMSEIDKGFGVVEYSRIQSRDMFRNLNNEFPAAAVNERADAQRKYGELMDHIDVTEETLQALQCALSLLDENRSAWKIQKGKIVFSDPKLEEDYKLFSHPVDAATMRWKRDFGGIESPPVAAPTPLPQKAH